MRWILGAALAALIGLIGVMGWRAQQLATPQAPAGIAPALAPAPAIDAAAAAERLSAALALPTISRTPGVVEDPAAFDALRTLLETSYPAAHAVMTREIVAGHSLFYTWAGSDPALSPIVLMAHQDVVPAAEETLADWPAPPFSGQIKDGFIHGRGAIDDKGSLIALMEAAEALAKAGFAPKRTIHFAFGHDEEVMGAGARAMAEKLKASGRKAWFALDEGMAVVMDFPLSDGPVALIGVAEKGYLTVRVTAIGPGGHSSTPPAETSVEILARALTALNAEPFPASVVDEPVAGTLKALAPELGFPARLAIANSWALGGVLRDQVTATPAGDALARTTMAPTILEAGTKENVLPQEAHALINLRLHPRDSVEGALAHMRAAVAGIEGVSIEPEGVPNEPSPVSPSAGPAYELIAAAAGAFAPEGAPVAPMLVLAATDGRHFADAAEAVYRFQPVWLDTADLAAIHGVGERISVENLKRLADFYAVLIATGAR